MISLYKQDGEVLYGIKEFFLDSIEDLQNLPTNIRSGSTAIVISTGRKYVLNGSKQWVALGISSSSGENNTTACSCDELLRQLDADGDGVIDKSEETNSITMLEF